LGYYRLIDAYPVPFVDYEFRMKEFIELLGRDFRNILLAGSLSNYDPFCGIPQTLLSARKSIEQLLEA